MGFFLWLEQTGLSVWMRETPSLWAFPFVLFLHTLGLAMLAGISTALSIWILAFADKYPLAPMRQYFPIMWLGFGINALSGLLLLVAYPAKALTNPVFYIKLIAVFAAFALLQWIHREVFVRGEATRTMAMSPAITRSAGTIIVLWLIATGTGRFLAYTHNMLMASEAFF